MVAFDRAREAKKGVESLSVEEARREHTEDTLFVDIRDVRERWIRGSIPGAKHVPRGMLEFWADPDPDHDYARDFFDTERRVVLYCKGGMRSALAAETLIGLGYEDVAHIDDGFDGWDDADNFVEDVPQKDYKNRGEG